MAGGLSRPLVARAVGLDWERGRPARMNPQIAGRRPALPPGGVNTVSTLSAVRSLKVQRSRGLPAAPRSPFVTFLSVKTLLRSHLLPSLALVLLTPTLFRAAEFGDRL